MFASAALGFLFHLLRVTMEVMRYSFPVETIGAFSPELELFNTA